MSFLPCSSSTSSTSATSSQPATQSTQPAASNTSHHDVNVGVIIGPVVAVVVVLIAFMLGVIWWRRHKVASVKAEESLSPAPWYGGYNLDQPGSKDPEKGGRNTLGVPVQSYNGSSAAVAPEPYDPYRRDQPPQASTTQLSSLTGSQVRPLPPPPASHPSVETPSPPSAAAPAQGMDVNTIIELIAQRIDRPPAHPSVSPPQYPQ